MNAVSKKIQSDIGANTIFSETHPCLSGTGLTKIEIVDNVETVASGWRQLEQVADATIYQTAYWADLCLSSMHHCDTNKPFIVTGWKGTELQMVLPLFLEKSGISNISWIGGTHANICFGLFHPDLTNHCDEKALHSLMSFIAAQAPNTCVANLLKQPASWDGHNNPLLALSRQPSVNNAYIINLEGGFDAVLAHGNAKRKRKKFRQQCRAAEQIGGYRLAIADNPEMAVPVLDNFKQQKARQFKKMGIENVFEVSGMDNFLHRLAQSVKPDCAGEFVLFSLEIGGRIRAIFGAGRHKNHLSGFFSSITDDELTAISPGEMLLYLMVQHCCELGIESIDLGSGDERYKRSWCSEEIALHDMIVPMSSMALPVAKAVAVKQSLKREIRANPKLWSMVKTVRQKLGGEG